MTATVTVQPLVFELKYRKVAAPYERPRAGQNWDKEEWGERDEARYATLPSTPAGFTPMKGAFPLISSRADFLNLQQFRAGFIDWFWYPETVPSESDPDHCDVCRNMRADRDL